LLTQLMGGELNVSSRLGEGSTFVTRLYLPETNTPPPTRGVQLRPVSGYLGSRRKLLVVDDQPTQRQMLAGLLMPLGFEIREAASGRECLESVLAEPPDAVLLDLTMDDMDGWETARQLRAAGFQTLPIIVVSANAFENQPEKLEAAGCQGFVDKPVVESQLLDMLERHLQIEWVAELAAPVWTQGYARGPMALPEEHASELMRLARLGHMHGLKRALDELEHAHPECRAEAARLRALAERFELDALIDQLNQTLRDARPEGST
jgi:CheY-like chemotaxis protein